MASSRVSAYVMATSGSLSPWSPSAVFPLESYRVPRRRHRNVSGRCHAQMPSLAVASGMSTEIDASIVHLHVGLLQKMVDLGFALPTEDSAFSWLTIAVPGLLWYVAGAAPGCLSGLLDYAYAPVHSLSNRSFDADEVQVGRQIGQGSFGIVYEGYIGRGVRKKSREELHVVLKKVKPRSKGAAEIHDSEIHINRRVQRTAPSACADFLGTTEVSSSQTRGRLSEGLWLVWRFEGDRTLSHYLQQKNFPENIAQSILGRKISGTSRDDIVKQSNEVIRKITSQILSGLRDLHRTGLVHRDVKPSNLVLAEDSGTFKLIDLGAAVDLRSGYNYVPDETIIDPYYAAPERHVMPVSTPRLPPDPLCSVVSPLLWLLNSPDRFDLYSVGVVLLQMALKPLRQDIGLITFNTEFKRAGYNLDVWRRRCRFSREEFALLDDDGTAGWELLKCLLQPRHNTDFFIWPSLGRSRPSAAAALKHRFLTGSSAGLPQSLKFDLSDFPFSLWPGKLIPKLSLDNLPSVSFPLQLKNWNRNFRLPRVSVQDTYEDLIATWKYETLPKLQNMGIGTEVDWKQISDSVQAVTPLATLSAATLTAAWLVMSALRNSGRTSYEVGKTALDFAAISGALGLTGFVVIRLLIEAQEKQSSSIGDLEVGAAQSPLLEGIDIDMAIKSRKNDVKTIQEHREQEKMNPTELSEAKEATDLAPVESLVATAVQSSPQSLKISELLRNKVQTSSLERTDKGLAEAVQSMQLQLASLESSIAAGRLFSQHQEHQISQMEKLLKQRPQETTTSEQANN